METEQYDIQEPQPQRQAEPPKTAKDLLAELGRLLLLLLWAITKRLIRITYKTIRFTIRFIKLCIDSTIEWWRDKSTQEKVRAIRLKTRRWCQLAWHYFCIGCKKFWRGTVIFSKTFVKYTKIAAKLTWLGLVWLCVNFVQLIIHTKPVLIRLGKWLKTSYRQAIVKLRLMRRGIRLSNIKRRRRYQAFKRNGGMKGALEHATSSLKNSIQSYMEEEQNEADPDAITEDDIFEERFEEIEQANKAHVIGKKIFSSVKNIVDVNE